MGDVICAEKEPKGDGGEKAESGSGAGGGGDTGGFDGIEALAFTSASTIALIAAGIKTLLCLVGRDSTSGKTFLHPAR